MRTATTRLDGPALRAIGRALPRPGRHLVVVRPDWAPYDATGLWGDPEFGVEARELARGLVGLRLLEDEVLSLDLVDLGHGGVLSARRDGDDGSGVTYHDDH